MGTECYEFAISLHFCVCRASLEDAENEVDLLEAKLEKVRLVLSMKIPLKIPF